MVEPPRISSISSASAMASTDFGEVDSAMGAKPSILRDDDGKRQSLRDAGDRYELMRHPQAAQSTRQHGCRDRIDDPIKRSDEIRQQSQRHDRNDDKPQCPPQDPTETFLFA